MKHLRITIGTLLASLGIICAADETEQTLKIKGLYIGMTITDARDILNTKVKEITGKEFAIVKDTANTAWVLEPKDDPDNTAVVMRKGLGEAAWARLADTRPLVYDNEIPIVRANSHGVVTYIRIGAPLSDKLFNTADLTAQEFVKQLVNAYPIPTLKTFNDQMPGDSPGQLTVSGWEYLSPLGYKIRITDSKAVTIQAIPKQTQRSFD